MILVLDLSRFKSMEDDKHDTVVGPLSTIASLSEIERPLVRLDSSSARCLGLIVSYPSGVVYTNRTQAVAGAAPSVEGVFLPIGEEDQYETICRLLDDEVGPGLSVSHVDLIDEVFSQDHTTKVLSVARERLGESHTGWIFVRIGRHPDCFPSPPLVATRNTVADRESPINEASSPVFGFGATWGILAWPVPDAVSQDEFTSRIPTAAEIDRVSLRVAGPSYGWLSVVLELGDYRLDLNASMVLNDPLSELFDWLACKNLSDHGLRRVCLRREPEGYAVDVVGGSVERLSISVRFDESFIPPMAGSSMMLRHRCWVERETFARAVVRGLREWLDGATDVKLLPGVRERYRSMLDAAISE